MTTEPQEIDNEVTASDEVVTPPPLLPDKVDAKPVSTITFPGMEEFKNEPVLFQEKLKAKYDSLSVAP